MPALDDLLAPLLPLRPRPRHVLRPTLGGPQHSSRSKGHRRRSSLLIVLRWLRPRRHNRLSHHCRMHIMMHRGRGGGGGLHCSGRCCKPPHSSGRCRGRHPRATARAQPPHGLCRRHPLAHASHLPPPPPTHRLQRARQRPAAVRMALQPPLAPAARQRAPAARRDARCCRRARLKWRRRRADGLSATSARTS